MPLRTTTVAVLFTAIVASSGWSDDASKADDLVETMVRSAAKGDQQAVLEAISSGADINGKSELGLTAWMAAKRAGYDSIATLLESKGARTDISAPSLEQLVDQGFQEKFGIDGPGCAILVARDGRILFEKASGNADLERKLPVTTDTKFRIGSLTKQFTAAAILKLQEDGKLSVTDKLSKFIPDFPRGDEVTLHHLLTHTSGIKSYTSKPEFMESVTKPTTEIDLIQSFQNDPYDFNPGERFSYNNSGYFLLGHIIGKVAGTSYAEYLEKIFFQPLSMTNSGVYSSDLKLDDEARGYSIIDGKPELAINWDMSWAGGAGAIYSTLDDLYKWNEAVFSGNVLGPQSLALAFRPTLLNDATKSDYGYGWMLGTQRGLSTIQHSGGLNGFQSYLVRYPEQKATIVVLTNALPSGDLPPPSTIGQKIGELLLWEVMDQREIRIVDSAVDPSTFKDFVGTYDYGTPILLEVTLEGEQLYAQLSGQQKLAIYPRNATTFFWKAVDAEVEFVRNDEGKVVKVIHRQNETTRENKRLPDLKSIELTEEQLAPYVGKYDYGSAVMTVTREGKQLIAQLTGQPAFKIFPESETKFVWRVVKAEVEFVKDENGNVTKGIHTQGGRTFDAARIAEIKPIEVTEEKLDEYVGRYNYGLLSGKMEVTRDGKKLMAKLRGQPAFEIVPVANDEFRWKDVNASIKFERGDDGHVVRGLHTQGGRTIKVPRLPARPNSDN